MTNRDKDYSLSRFHRFGTDKDVLPILSTTRIDKKTNKGLHCAYKVNFDKLEYIVGGLKGINHKSYS